MLQMRCTGRCQTSVQRAQARVAQWRRRPRLPRLRHCKDKVAKTSGHKNEATSLKGGSQCKSQFTRQIRQAQRTKAWELLQFVKCKQDANGQTTSLLIDHNSPISLTSHSPTFLPDDLNVWMLLLGVLFVYLVGSVQKEQSI